MKTNKELVKELNELKILQKEGDWAENLPVGIWNEIDDKYKEVAYKIDVDTHRHYETAITVIENKNGFIGIEHITNMFSEQQYYEDCYHTMGFYEMGIIQTTTYIKMSKI